MKRTRVISIFLIMLLMGGVWGGTPLLADDASKIKQDVQSAEEALGKLRKDLADQEEKQRANIEAQTNAGDDTKEELKKKAAKIAEHLNTLRDDISRKVLYINDKRAELRDAARNEAVSAVHAANGKAGKNDKQGSVDSLKDAKRNLRDWEDAIKACKIYSHVKSARLRDSSSKLEIAEAQSELGELETGLTLLEAEQSRLADELKELESIQNAAAAAKAVADQWKDTEKLIRNLTETVKRRQKDVDGSLNNGDERRAELQEFIREG